MSDKHRRPAARARGGSPQAPLTRRGFVRGVLAASASVAAQWALGAHAAADGAAGLPSTRRADAVLRAVLNCVIPPSGAMPGAGDAGVVQVLDLVATANPSVQAHMRRAIGLCTRSDGRARSDGAIERALRQWESARPADFDLFAQAVYTSYYTRPQVLAALAMPLERAT